MADIRINALATTATTPASDDYLALDGTAQGTRKILATNIANNVTDVILGSSGPSVKSTLSARAPRQGLVFDGTAGTTWAGFTPSSSDFTVAAWFSATSLAANNVIIDGTGPSSGFAFYVATDGSIRRLNRNAGTTETTAAGLVVTGKRYHIAYVRGAFYLNGVSVLTFTDTQNYNAALTRIGWSAGSDSFCTGFLSVLIYNRALSAAEVVALYEAGAPSGADYPVAVNGVAAGGNLLTSGVWGSGGTGITVSGTSNTGFTASGTGNNAFAGGVFGQIGASISARVGMRYRATWTYTAVSGETPTVGIAWDGNGVWSNTVSATAGSGIFTITSNQNVAKLAFLTSNGAATSYSVSNITLTPLGLLLAPDAAQAGGGLVWYDTSGNAANITLPASGVSWNVPWASTIPGAATVASASENVLSLTTSYGASGNNRLLRLITSNSAVTNSGFTIESAATNAATRNWGVSSNNTAYGDLAILQSNALGGNPLTAGTIALYVAPSRNFLLGTTTDSANGKLQLATHTTSAGGIGFGTVTSLYASSVSGCLELAAASGTTGGFKLYNTTNQRGQFVYSGTDVYIDASTLTGQLIFRTNGSTTALTLDSSQNATFAGSATIGTLSPGNNTAAHFLTGYAANQSWPARISAIYDANFVDTYVTLNGTLTGTRATPTFTGATTGGAYLRFNGGTSEFVLGTYVSGAGAAAVPALTLKAGNATFAGSIAINNTVQTAAAVASTHKVTISIGGSTYYLLATNV